MITINYFRLIYKITKIYKINLKKMRYLKSIFFDEIFKINLNLRLGSI